MYKTALISLTSILLIACNNSNRYTIYGTTSAPELEGKIVYLSQYEGRTLHNIDSTFVKNSAFSFSGKADKASLKVIRTSELQADKVEKLTFILENGKIIAHLDSASGAKGTPLNDTLTAYNNTILPIQKAIDQLSDTYDRLEENKQTTKSIRNKMTVKLDKLEQQANDISERYIRNNLNNAAGAYIYWQNRASFTPEKQSEILIKAGKLFKEEPFVQIIAGRLKMMEHVAIGKKYTDLIMTNPQGNKVALSQYAGRGKYTLILFWASWCPSCREDIPYLVDLYNKQKSDKFEIVGISFDRDETAWKEGISALKMTFPQMSDLRFWDSDGAKTYAVRAIPHNVLLDKNGTILEKDLSIGKLSEFLKTIK